MSSCTAIATEEPAVNDIGNDIEDEYDDLSGNMNHWRWEEKERQKLTVKMSLAIVKRVFVIVEIIIPPIDDKTAP
jgi:hypothetical protein